MGMRRQAEVVVGPNISSAEFTGIGICQVHLPVSRRCDASETEHFLVLLEFPQEFESSSGPTAGCDAREAASRRSRFSPPWYSCSPVMVLTFRLLVCVYMKSRFVLSRIVNSVSYFGPMPDSSRLKVSDTSPRRGVSRFG